MSLTTEQILAAHKANMETLFGLTSKAFEGVEKLVGLNITASRAALNEAASHTQAVSFLGSAFNFSISSWRARSVSPDLMS